MTEHEYQRILEEEFEKYQQENHVLPNIMVLGKVGVGKSSLINNVFGRDVAKVSDTIPETQDFECYYGKNNNSNVNLIDSKGYEINTGIGENANQFNSSAEAFKDYAEKILVVAAIVLFIGKTAETIVKCSDGGEYSIPTEMTSEAEELKDKINAAIHQARGVN